MFTSFKHQTLVCLFAIQNRNINFNEFFSALPNIALCALLFVFSIYVNITKEFAINILSIKLLKQILRFMYDYDST